MFDKKTVQNLLQMDDETLRKKVTDAAIASGADKYKTAVALSDMTKLRGMMQALNDKQISELVAKLPSEAQKALKEQLRKNGITGENL